MQGLKWIFFVQLCITPCLGAVSFLGLFYLEDRDYNTPAEGALFCGTDKRNSERFETIPLRPSSSRECKDHDEPCILDSDCCAIENMFCWDNRTGNAHNPLCKCKATYGWNQNEWRCYPISFAQQMMMAAFMAFSVAILIALIAFCIHSCKYCWSYGERIRHMRDVRRDQRHRRRRQMRMPRDQHNISAFVEVDRDTPIKLPTYDEIESDKIIFTTVTPMATLPDMSGTVRSLPPAYESIVTGEFVLTNDTPIEGVTVITSIVPLQNSAERRDSQPQQQHQQQNGQNCSQEGVTNEAYQAVNHL
ncbi:uncharacterized protein LOC135946423 [Cloeon dipterum]|uniref:uncharacterized protein LOC135946423 n=1 Tax=Cloeon dipterum TaxID=197152 RepID=UPI00321FD752